MLEFNFYEYQREHRGAKIKSFLEYLEVKFSPSDSKEFDNDYLSLLGQEELIESLKRYINDGKITAQGTANNYIKDVTAFFKELSDVYNIKNEIISNREKNDEFLAMVKQVISVLKKSESKDTATDEQFERLNNGLNEYIETFDLSEVKDEVDDFWNNKIQNISKYHRFISVIPIKLILKFALKNETIVLLDVSALDIENKTLKVNDMELPLDEELLNLFKTYIDIRKYVLNLYSLQESKLFIKHNGTPYIKPTKNREKTADYGIFLKIMLDIVETQSGEIFATRRLLEMLDKGMDVYTVLRLSEKYTKKFFNLLDEYNESVDINSKIQQFFNGDTSIDKKYTVKKKENNDLSLICPFCGKESYAISDEWVLVQYEENGKKFLACRKCKGENGKHIL